MAKYYFILFLSVGFVTSLFSQEAQIITKFSQQGSLYSDLNETQEVAEFKKNDECTILQYLGDDFYQVKFKEWTGFVYAENLVVSDAMIDLVIAFEDRGRLAAIKKEEERKKRVEEIIRKNEEEKQKEIDDSIAKVEAIRKIEQARLDSIAKVQEKIKERKAFVEDSINKVRLKEIETKRQDSIARVLENKRLAALARQRDSLAKIEEAKKLKEIATRDSIRKVEETKRKVSELKRQDSIARVQLVLARQIDSLAKIEEAKKLRDREIREDIVKSEEKKRKEIEQRRKDPLALIANNKMPQSITKVDEKPVALEEIKTSIECKYLINEFDEFYGIRIIRTEPYKIADKLTIELHKQGQSENVFFNLSVDLGCASYFTNNKSYVKITLENNEVVTLYHTWDMDCGNFSLKARLQSAKKESLKKSPIKSIWLQGTEGYFEITDVLDKTFFINHLNCLE